MTARCTVTDPALLELSGLAVDAWDRIWAMADGGRRVELHRLDPGSCAIVETRTAAVDPYDAEDLAIGADGTFWVADTGDNRRTRETVAMIALPPDGAARVYRLSYPDGPHDAEALLVGADAVPVIVTKEIGGLTEVYRPAGPLSAVSTTPLTRVATIRLPQSDTTGGPIGGGITVTGAARSADGRVVALRTYTDAWLFRVPESGDVVAALDGVPLRVPLPDEPQGEAVAFLRDGTLLSGSEHRVRPGELRAVGGAVQDVLAAGPAALGSGSAAGDGSGIPADGQTGPDTGGAAGGSPAWGPAMIGGAAVVGLLGLVAAAMTLHTRRRS